MKGTILFVVLIISGCSTDSADIFPRPSESKPYPGIMSKPSAENRRAIMSGERPDWNADENHGAQLLTW